MASRQDRSDVASLFSSQTALRRSGAMEEGSTSEETGSRSEDLHALSMDEINARLKELERQPTQDEIDALVAQYEDDSSEDEESESGSSNRASVGRVVGDGDNSRREDLIMKVLVVGNARCGKTSTIRRYVSKDFSEEYSSTIGADFIEKVIDYDAELRIHLQLWDIAGQDRFAKLTRAYFREAKGALIVCDITRENTIEAVVTWKKEIDSCCKDLNDGDSIPVVMIANKSDLLLDPLSALNIGVNMQKCVTNNGIIEWFRTSAKSGEHIDEAFQCLLDKLVQNHREELRVSDEGEAHVKRSSRDDIIRLSKYEKSPLSSKSDSGICECN